VIEYDAMGDVGTILNPRSLKGQLFGGSMLGLGHAKTQRWAYDQQYGVALARRFYQNKPPTILDAPLAYEGTRSIFRIRRRRRACAASASRRWAPPTARS
jgi:CO/xanthine dehydrogenase Mo-binding subunit